MLKLIFLIAAVIFGLIATFNIFESPRFNFLAASVTCIAVALLV